MDIKALKTIIHAISTKEVDFSIDKDERGEVIIYTGLVEKKGKYREAKPEERHDYELMAEVESEQL